MRLHWVAVGLALALGVSSPARAEPGAVEIMRRSFLGTKFSDSRGTLTMTLRNQSGHERVRSTQTTSKLREQSTDQKRVIRFTAPADVRGTASLMIEHSDGDDDIWIYLPALRKVRRLVASNKKDSFVGTDFSYGDIIGHKVEDWSPTLVGSEVLDGVDTWVIEATPVSATVKSNSGYGKRKLWIRKDNAVAIKGTYWDTGGKPIKEFSASDVRLVDPANDKWQAFRMAMRNLQTGHSTELVYASFEVGVGLDDGQFTERYLETES